MQVRKEKRKDGTTRYRYRYYHEGKLRTVAQESLPFSPRSDAQAEALRRKLEAIYEKDKAEKRLDEKWHEKYFDFRLLEIEFSNYRKRVAKNSYEDKLSYFRNYIIKFFVEKERKVNMLHWKTRREAFFEWLLEREKIRGKGKLSKQTINHILTEFNVFIDYMCKKGHISEKFEISLIPRSELTERGAEWVIKEDEKEIILEKLKAKNETSADLFLILLSSGMRINELLSLGISDVRKGVIPHRQLENLLKETFGGRKLLCYLLLEKQIDPKNGEYKPLKSKRKISLKHARYIPVYEVEVYNCIVKYIKHAKERGSLQLFHDLYDYSQLNKDLAKAYEGTRFNSKTSHACRHTYAAYLGGEDLTGVLQKLILGHKRKNSG